MRAAAQAAVLLAREPSSPQVTDWGARLGWVAVLLLCVALLYAAMRRGWRRREARQSELPEPPAAPAERGEPLLRASGSYHGTTTAGQWLDRVVAHGLGTRSRARLTLTPKGLWVERPGARDFFIPEGWLRGARRDRGIAGKVLVEGGLLVVTWSLGGRELDSGFRLDRAAEHGAWAEALRSLTPGPADVAATPHHHEKGA